MPTLKKKILNTVVLVYFSLEMEPAEGKKVSYIFEESMHDLIGYNRENIRYYKIRNVSFSF